MGGSGTEVVLEKQKSTSKSVTSKVTSSITIYPSDSSGPRAVPSEAPRERHTSTSNIQVGPQSSQQLATMSAPLLSSLFINMTSPCSSQKLKEWEMGLQRIEQRWWSLGVAF